MLYASRTVSGAESPFRCEKECDQESRFTCRSITFLEAEAVCLLSAESRATVPAAALRFHPRALYSQKNCREPRPAGLTTHAGLSTGSTTTSGFTRAPSPAAFCTFERTVGVELRFVPRERLPSRSPVGVVDACHRECQRVGSECRAFLVQYAKFQSCFWLRDAALENKEALLPANDFAYYEKVCFRERPCSKLWAFERVPGHVMQIRATREFPHVATRADCEELCLREHCRSAVYLHRPRICRLYSGATRRSHPSSFQRVPDPVDYLENQCVPESSTCQYREHAERFSPYIERLGRALNLAECQRQCDAESDFSCRSLSFEPLARECSLSADDLASLPLGDLSLLPRRGAVYSEKGSCERISLQCNQQDMVLTVNFDEAFNGRMYARGNPSNCYMVGTGQSTVQFAISMGPRCGTRQEGVGRYVNDVVIQQHPVIVTDHDNTVRVVCSFETGDRTVTLGVPYPGASRGVEVTTRLQPTFASVVTNTAPPPNVVMRVVDTVGRDATVVGLGDPLNLRIELREQTAFSLFARNLYARSTSGEALFLIDSAGCPTDPSIFPALQLDPRDRRTLQAAFKAFRFPTSGLVNFEVQIRFCQGRCDPMKCPGDVDSYGKRRRREVWMEDHLPLRINSTGFLHPPGEDGKEDQDGGLSYNLHSIPHSSVDYASGEGLDYPHVRHDHEIAYSDHRYPQDASNEELSRNHTLLSGPRVHSSFIRHHNEPRIGVSNGGSEGQKILDSILRYENKNGIIHPLPLRQESASQERKPNFKMQQQQMEYSEAVHSPPIRLVPRLRDKQPEYRDFRSPVSQQQNNGPPRLLHRPGPQKESRARSLRRHSQVISSQSKGVPEEVPLSLAIVVGDDPAAGGDWGPRLNITPIDGPRERCSTPQPSLITTVLTVSVVHIAAAVALVLCCCRWKHKRRSLEKSRPLSCQPVPPSRPANSDIIFRSVYDAYDPRA